MPCVNVRAVFSVFTDGVGLDWDADLTQEKTKNPLGTLRVRIALQQSFTLGYHFSHQWLRLFPTTCISMGLSLILGKLQIWARGSQFLQNVSGVLCIHGKGWMFGG